MQWETGKDRQKEISETPCCSPGDTRLKNSREKEKIGEGGRGCFGIISERKTIEQVIR